MQFHRLLVEAPLSQCIRVHSTTRFGHTGPSSCVYDDSRLPRAVRPKSLFFKLIFIPVEM
jgi:hypothetical protein